MSSCPANCEEMDFSYKRSELIELSENQNKLSSYIRLYKKIFNRRNLIIEYFVDLHQKLKTSTRTLYLAITLFDNFMVLIDSNSGENRESIDLIQIPKFSLIAFYVAYKFEEPYKLTIDSIQKYFIRNSSIFTKEEIIKLEKNFLKTLKFHLQFINIFSFHECFYGFLYENFLDYEEIEKNCFNKFIKDIMTLSDQIITVISNFKEIMFTNHIKENDSLQLSELAVVSLKISIFFFDSINEIKKKKLKKFNDIINEFFMIDQLNNLKLNRNAFNLFSLIKDLMKDEDKKIFSCLRKILRELNLIK